MVFHPSYPIRDLFLLICGVLMIIPACFALKKVHEGSKNQFAYVLLSFTILLGIAYVGEAFTDAYTKKVLLLDGTNYLPNLYAYETFYCLQYISALQGWIFGMCYLKSATSSSI